MKIEWTHERSVLLTRIRDLFSEAVEMAELGRDPDCTAKVDAASRLLEELGQSIGQDLITKEVAG